MSRASAELVDLIHSLAAQALKDEIERAMERASLPRTIEIEEDGETVSKPNPDCAPVNPQLLDKALKFLKDNGVKCLVGPEGIEPPTKPL
jgi:hypothetical protein